MSGEHSDQLLTDEEMVVRLLAKDEEAFNLFYDRYAPNLVRRLYRLTGDMVKAKDALQQTMLEILNSLPSYKGKGALGAWVNRIATFVVIDRFRQDSRQRGFLERWSVHLTSLQERPSPLPHEMLEDESIRCLVREQLEFLAARKRIAVLLCDLEGLSLEEAGEQMGVPIGTVSSRLHHGRRELRQRIKNELKRRGLSVEDLLHG